jgi:hypothetical protein
MAEGQSSDRMNSDTADGSFAVYAPTISLPKDRVRAAASAKIRCQSGHRHGLFVGADRNQPRAFGLWPPAFGPFTFGGKLCPSFDRRIGRPCEMSVVTHRGVRSRKELNEYVPDSCRRDAPVPQILHYSKCNARFCGCAIDSNARGLSRKLQPSGPVRNIFRSRLHCIPGWKDLITTSVATRSSAAEAPAAHEC